MKILWENRCVATIKWEKEHGILKKHKRDRTKWSRDPNDSSIKTQENITKECMRTRKKPTDILDYVYKTFIDNVNTSGA